METYSAQISKSVYNSMAGLESLGAISTNVANMNTTGYKPERFENVLKESGRIDLIKRTDFRQGVLMPTERELDVGLSQPGFFPVTTKTGQAAFTRDGSFQVNSDGLLVTSNGSIVGSGVKIPADYQKLSIKSDGRVNVLYKLGDKEETIGRIPIVNFVNPEGLKRIDDNQYTSTVASGDAKVLVDYRGVKQGTKEMSNVDIYETVGDVMAINAQISASAKMIKFMDDIYKESISLRQ